MIYKLTEKNKFGGHTYQIKLDSIFHIFINETNANSYSVDFKEWKWFNYKLHFSFISNGDLKETVRQTFEKTYDFFSRNSDYAWTREQMTNKLNQTLEIVDMLK